MNLQEAGSAEDLDDIPSDTHAAILSILHELKDAIEFPRAVFKHQLYTVLDDRTLLDQQLEELRKNQRIILFRLGNVGDEDTAIMLQSDFSKLVSATVPCAALAARYISAASDPKHSLSITKQELLAMDGMMERHLITLVRVGCLAIRDATSYWLSFPRTGLLLQHIREGRSRLVRMIRNSKYKQILQKDLLKRKMKQSRLSMQYHISDAIGRGTLVAIATTSGFLLRL